MKQLHEQHVRNYEIVTAKLYEYKYSLERLIKDGYLHDAEFRADNSAAYATFWFDEMDEAMEAIWFLDEDGYIDDFDVIDWN